jgi:hypothetical protein
VNELSVFRIETKTHLYVINMEINKYINLGRAFGIINFDLSAHTRSFLYDCVDNCDAFSQAQ